MSAEVEVILAEHKDVLAKTGLLDRVSISPSETKVCFEYQTGFRYKDTGRILYVAAFDAEKPGNSGVLLRIGGEAKIWPPCVETPVINHAQKAWH